MSEQLPPGFKLDEPEDPQLPAGFTLDPPPIGAEVADQVQRARGGGAGQSMEPLQALRVLDDFVRSLASGATFGFADEIAAGANELLGNITEGTIAEGTLDGGTYEENLARERARDKSIDPVVRTTGEVIGGVGGALALPAVAPARATAVARAGMQAVPRVLRPVAAGAGYGGLMGAGQAEEDRIGGAQTGALIGAAGGAVIPPALRAIQGVAGGVRNALGGISRSSQERALMRIERALQTPPERLAARVRAGGEGAMLADIGDEGLRGLAGTVARTPGQGQQFARNVIRARNVRTGQRMQDLIRRTVSGEDFQGTIDDVIATRRSAAQQAYQEAFEANPVHYSAIIERILRSKQGQKALREARSFPEYADMPWTNIELLDQVYKTIGGRAQKAMRSGNTQLSNSLNDMRQSLRMAMPLKYRRALEQYADDSAMVNALEGGRDFILQNTAGKRITAQAVREMSESERDLFMIGASEGLQDMMAATPDRQIQSMLRKLFGSQRIRERMRQIMPSKEAYNRFRKGIIREAQNVETSRQVLGGSPTQERLDAAREALQSLGVAFDVGRSAVRGDVGQVIASGARAIASRMPRRSLPESGELGRMLFDESMARNLGTAQALQQREAQALAQALRQEALRRQATQTLIPGVAAGSVGISNR